MCLLVGQFCQCFKSHVINVDPMSTTTNSNTTLSEYINYSTYMLWLFYSPQILYSLQKIIMKHGDKLQFVKHIFFLDSIKHNTFYCALYFYRTTRFIIDFFILLDLSIHMAAFSNFKVPKVCNFKGEKSFSFKCRISRELLKSIYKQNN
jgi:hypothetical protein